MEVAELHARLAEVEQQLSTLMEDLGNAADLKAQVDELEAQVADLAGFTQMVSGLYQTVAHVVLALSTLIPKLSDTAQGEIGWAIRQLGLNTPPVSLRYSHLVSAADPKCKHGVQAPAPCPDCREMWQAWCENHDLVPFYY